MEIFNRCCPVPSCGKIFKNVSIFLHSRHPSKDNELGETASFYGILKTSYNSLIS